MVLRLLFALALTLGALCTSCAVVKPYQRGKLAQRCMQTESSQAREVEEHVYEYREGATGTSGVTGGGCGCN